MEPQNALVPIIAFPMEIRNWSKDVIQKVLTNKDVEVCVSEKRRMYHTINIKEAMQELMNVGNLLRLSYAGTKGGHDSNKDVALVLSKYHSFVNQAVIVSNKFVQTAIEALDLHRVASLAAKRHKYEMVLTKIEATGKIATQMAKISQDLIDLSSELCNLSEQTLLKTISDEVMSEKKRKEVEKSLEDLHVNTEGMNKRKAELQKAVDEAKDRELKAEKAANQARGRAFALSIIQGVLPLGHISTALQGGVNSLAKATTKILTKVLVQESGDNKAPEKPGQFLHHFEKLQMELAGKKQALVEEKDEEKIKELKIEIAQLEAGVKHHQEVTQNQAKAIQQVQNSLEQEASRLEEKEEKLAELRANLEKEQRDINVSLAESVVRLKHANLEKNDLDQAVISLEIAVKTMGKIKSIFENTKMFWVGVESHCQSLRASNSLQDLIEMDDADEIHGAIEFSAYSWLALTQLMIDAETGIQPVKVVMDSILGNLPTKAESQQLIKNFLEEHQKKNQAMIES